jgi:hypothetical protein
VQVNFSLPHDVDAPVAQAADERPGEMIRLRFQPRIWRAQPGRDPGYVSWPKVTWIIECTTVEEARELRLGLGLFFDLAVRVGPTQMKHALERLAQHA